MNEPHGEQRQVMKEGITALRQDRRFIAVLDWIKAERDARDAENRYRGHENTTSEADALTTILQFTGHEPKRNASANAE